MAKNALKLDTCVQRLKSLTRNTTDKPPSQNADLYSAAIGLLCHLKADQSKLQASWRKDQNSLTCPSPNEIPAITAVIQDAKLFDALVGCLRVTSGTTATGLEPATNERSATGHHHHHHHHHLSHQHHHQHHHSSSSINSRKRSNSVSSEIDLPASKAIKLSHSPVPTTSQRLYGRHQVDSNAAGGTYEYAPTWNVPIVAATILYTAFVHLDHWPAPLAKAYADDCFGPRLWVDDERCKLLVENLQLLHKGDSDETTKDANEALLADAAQVSEAYSRLPEILADEDLTADHSSPLQMRRGSLSSVGSAGGGSVNHPSSVSSLKRPNSRDETDAAMGNGKKKMTGKLAKKRRKAAKNIDGDDGSSSSSGEEDEEVIVSANSCGGGELPSPKRKNDRTISPTNSHVGSEGGVTDSLLSRIPKQILYPPTQQKLDLKKVRQRYFGMNLKHSQDAISLSLTERLEAKAKQNSSLLQSLHAFTTVPGVRSQVAANLEKWLQSPGLSGLARTLFSSTVSHLKNVDPPLQADLEAIRRILSMRLKANQLSAHVENVTAIAAKIPTSTVARFIYNHLLTELLATMERGADASASNHLKMVGAVYSALPKGISADGIAASLLLIIGKSTGSSSLLESSRAERKQLVKQLKQSLQLIAHQLGSSFDVSKVLESLLSFNIRDDLWTVRDEEDRARLVLQCILLLVPLPKDRLFTGKAGRKVASLSEAETGELKKNLTTARKLVLTWFCADYGPHFQFQSQNTNEDEDVVGAGAPDYNSSLGGVDSKRKIPSWLTTARCLLFMENGDSPRIKRFLRGSSAIDENDATWFEDKYRIDRCYELGCDFDNEMMWIILKSASLEDGGISPEIALTLLEHLFESCGVNGSGVLEISDMMLAWELYSLVTYEPPETVLVRKDALKQDHDSDGDKFDDAVEKSGMGGADAILIETADLDLPQLAYPGLWWRVTLLALVMCGAAPNEIGATIWEEHPTLRSIIKMVVSSRYRFPTVDCDELDRAETKKNEQLLREEEANIAETLFLPLKPARKHEVKDSDPSHGRSRISARQQQKREKALQKKREKEAAEALLEESKRKKKLRAAQKTIILWDPTSPARKPPREAAELLVAVEAHFGLSRTFQRNVEPDFLLLTIGKTSRSAIERAYDWLIPIISDIPDIISRLHASASCVLLLRAYGTEGDERAQLKELSAPLLCHVGDSLTGRFGEQDAVRAFDLLMSDVASHNPNRRRCARRVLFDAISKIGEYSEKKKSSWFLNILQLQHVTALIGDAIKHMTAAICFERGLVLRNLVLALNDFIAFAEKSGVKGDYSFASIFINNISSRPIVCAEALTAYDDFRELGIDTIYKEFEKCLQDSSSSKPENNVVVKLCQKEGGKEVVLSLSLLQAASVLLSIYKEGNDEARGILSAEEKDDKATASTNSDVASSIWNLADMLLHPIASKCEAGNEGLASAKLAESGKSVVSVESWVMLAKARSDTIARRAALTAPTGFLPRLLLCSGLPRASLLTMVDRLGKLGETSDQRGNVFSQLLIPSANSEWDIGRLGHKKEVARKLLGRLSAYLRLNECSLYKDESQISTIFLDWLSQECATNEKVAKKPKHKHRTKTHHDAPTLSDASNLLKIVSMSENGEVKDHTAAIDVDDSDLLDEFRPEMEKVKIGRQNKVKTFEAQIKSAFEDSKPAVLEALLREQIGLSDSEDEKQTESLSILATATLHGFLSLEHPQDAFTRVVLSYVPYLTRSSGSPELWRVVFSSGDGSLSQILETLSTRCIALWRLGHHKVCYKWLLSVSRTITSEEYDIERICRYLLLASGQQSVHLEGFSAKISLQCVDGWGKSEEFVSSSFLIVVEAMKQATSAGFNPGLLSRNYLPDWLVLVLALAKCGRMQMKYICESVLKYISQPTDDLSLPLLRSVFLRLYVSNPFGMNLGSALIRNVLMDAAQEYSVSWLDWRSPLDGQLQDMLETVMMGSGQRLIRPLSDISKKHPLLILRKSRIITEFLEKDATSGVRRPKELSRGVVHGHSLTGPLNVKKDGKVFKLNVRHWGYSYTEIIWIALLDVMCAIPGPVLFGCGLNMGFLELLNVYVRLVFVQSQLRRNERESRLKEKLKEFFATFRKHGRSGWERWMTSRNEELSSFGDMKNVMIVCDFVDPKDVVKPS